MDSGYESYGSIEQHALGLYLIFSSGSENRTLVVSISKIFKVNFPLVGEKSTCHLVASHCIYLISDVTNLTSDVIGMFFFSPTAHLLVVDHAILLDHQIFVVLLAVIFFHFIGSNIPFWITQL
ncbi:hypothetical protein T12_16074 [Trichinella patagoniensis]|uniref:Uncharacterized protein n=1 Tax=Trichinella patagoniensis TaxID=990121 RepID=A0A0V1A8Y9_9BILA|nr:hypothetical protein T12_16074 [Trichinella patagoniensis]